MKQIQTWLFLAVLTTFSVGQSFAQSPAELVKEVSENVIAQLTKEQTAIQEDPNKVYEIVDAMVLPYFDFEYMAQLVLAKHWRKASDAEKQGFTDAFKNLLVRTYSNSLREFSGEEIVYLPFHSADDAQKATVSVEVLVKAGPPIPMDYQLRNKAGWKVFDVAIDGLSLVTNYRRSFGKEISNSSLSKLIKRLEDKADS